MRCASSTVKLTSTLIRKYTAILLSITACFTFGIEAAYAKDCIQASKNSNSALMLRAEPSSKSTLVRKLQPNETLPLIALMPGWYETQLADGQTVYAAKRSTEIVPCPDTAPEPAFADQETQYELHAIDVGTGLSVLVRGPDFSVLYDAGSNDDTARGEGNRAIAYLKTLKPSVETLTHVILSHPHRDHVELLPDVVTQLKPHDIWDSGAYNDICGYRNFLLAIAADPTIQYHTGTFDRGIESINMENKTCYGVKQPAQTLNLNHADKITDQRIAIGNGAYMSFLYVDGTPHQSFNENSLVVRLDLGDKRILLMGDAEAGGRNSPTSTPNDSSIEGKLLHCCSQELKADVLVVGHHGSKTSSRTQFLDAVGAKTFIVSAGPTKYATVVLPDQEVISELEKRGKVFRTDIEDDSCLMSPDKVGPDSDGKPGGCDNILVTIPSKKPITAQYRRVTD